MSTAKRSHHVRIDSTLTLGALVGLWGVLNGLAFPYANWWPLAHVALAPLALVGLRGRPLWKVALVTWLGGAAWWLIMVAWLRYATLPGYIAASLILGLSPMLFALGVRLMQRGLHVPMTFAVPLLWVSIEYLRFIGSLAFPWFLLAHPQPTLLIQIADLTGMFGVSFVTAMTSGLIVDLLTQPLVRRGGGLGRTVRVGLVSWAIVLAATLAYGGWRVHQYQQVVDAAEADPSRALRVAVVQTDVPQSNKNAPTVEQQIADFQALGELTEEAAGHGVDLIAWPETVIGPGLNVEYVRASTAGQYYRQGVERLVERFGVAILAGAHAYAHWNQGEVPDTWAERYNSAYLFEPTAEGVAVERFDKVHRVPFGEFLPFREAIPPLHATFVYFSPYDYDYALTPGAAVHTLTLDVPAPVGEAGEAVADGPGHDAARSATAWRLGTPICFEDVISYVCRRMIYSGGHKRGDALVNLTNDGWYPGTAQGPQHEQIARFRCVENRVPMARSVNRGVSSLIDSCGRVFARVQRDGRTQMVAGVQSGQLLRDDRNTLFARIGDAFATACLVFTALVLLVSWAAARLKGGTRE